MNDPTILPLPNNIIVKSKRVCIYIMTQFPDSVVNHP